MAWGFIVEMYFVLRVVVSSLGFEGLLESRFEIAIIHALGMAEWFVKC